MQKKKKNKTEKLYALVLHKTYKTSFRAGAQKNSKQNFSPKNHLSQFKVFMLL